MDNSGLKEAERKPAGGLEEKYYDFDGLSIRYVDSGPAERAPGAPAIFFIHGLGGSIEDNSACFPYLARDWRVVAFDCPGTGKSDKPDREYDIDYLTDFSLELATRLGLDKFYIAGGSQGGLQALLCCLRSPERIYKAAVYSPAGVWAPNPLGAAFFSALPPVATKLFFRISSMLWYSPGFAGAAELRREDLAEKDAYEQPGFGKHVFGCLVSQMSGDFRPVFRRIETPTLILWGTHDFGMPSRMGDELHGLMKDSIFEKVPRAGHNIPKERPEFFARRLTEFFSEG
ncbi:MAG: 2-hydroxy-6-oxononadienedioate/2-hydroxy-6-oxononatrienedioate hydrolase [bacterium ADurb.Bin236]|nr:MAG: 2-hydroxy-6-oxononadienedioate/2-hydroxy-6-oxononatrienedioate hydrolase [bacterium ADurb.Bin236]HPN94838.1 alpha/beta hydrolase [bacterium]